MQADLNLRWAHMSECTLSDVKVHLFQKVIVQFVGGQHRRSRYRSLLQERFFPYFTDLTFNLLSKIVADDILSLICYF